jgi:hypothetical protein
MGTTESPVLLGFGAKLGSLKKYEKLACALSALGYGQAKEIGTKTTPNLPTTRARKSSIRRYGKSRNRDH